MKKHFKVLCTIEFIEFDEVVNTKHEEYETWAVSKKKAESNIRYRLIGKKYNTVDYNNRYVEHYTFEAVEL